MKHVFRFLAAPRGADGTTWIITGDELHHLKKVCRLKIGDLVEVFDAEGAVAQGTITQLSSEQAEIEAKETTVFSRPERDLIFLVSAFDHGLVDEWLPALTELGFTGIGIYRTAQQPKHLQHEKVKDRHRRLVLAATKQCKRPFIPTVWHWNSEEAATFLAGFAGEKYLMEGGDYPSLGALLTAPGNGNGKGTVLVCGSEGGLTSEEVDAFVTKGGCQRTTLGPHVLRARTAVFAAAALAACFRVE